MQTSGDKLGCDFGVLGRQSDMIANGLVNSKDFQRRYLLEFSFRVECQMKKWGIGSATNKLTITVEKFVSQLGTCKYGGVEGLAR